MIGEIWFRFGLPVWTHCMALEIFTAVLITARDLHTGLDARWCTSHFCLCPSDSMVYINSPIRLPDWFTVVKWIISQLDQFLLYSSLWNSSFSHFTLWEMPICPTHWINPIVCTEGSVLLINTHFQLMLHTNERECMDQTLHDSMPLNHCSLSYSLSYCEQTELCFSE